MRFLFRSDLQMAAPKMDELEAILDTFDDPCWEQLKAKIDVPMLVVIGAQSSGKSSVLGEIVLLPIPTSDDVCTKFVTKLIFRRKPTVSVGMRIEPGPDRSQKEREKLKKFTTPSPEPKHLDKIIEAVARRLGADNDDRFCLDTLEIHIQSPEVPSITVIDTPGLTDVLMSDEQSDEDRQAIFEKITEYFGNQRCILVIIVETSADFSRHKILQHITQPDRARRTIGVLTKPDLVPGPKVAKRYVQLVRNENPLYRADLGWYLLRNRASNEQEWSREERDQEEKKVLAGPMFSEVPAEQKGADNFRAGVARQVLEFYKQQLVPIRNDVSMRLKEIETQVSVLPSQISDAAAGRAELVPILQRLHGLIKSSFFTPAEELWLPEHSMIQQRLQALDMQLQQHLQTSSPVYDLSDTIADVSTTTQPPSGVVHSLALDRLRQRAQELLANQSVLFGNIPWRVAQTLLLEVSKPWCKIMTTHLDAVTQTVQEHMETELRDCAPPHLQLGVCKQIMAPALRALSAALQRRIPRWWSDNLPPSNVQFQFSERVKRGTSTVWQRELDNSFVDAVATTCGIRVDHTGHLPTTDQAKNDSFDLEALRHALVSSLNDNRFAVAGVVTAVVIQYKVRQMLLMVGWRLTKHAGISQTARRFSVSRQLQQRHRYPPGQPLVRSALQDPR